jgi:hypothetical protein
MSGYILSSANRIYAGLEATFGAAPAVTSEGRIPAVRFQARQRTDNPERRDKTGSRTMPGRAPGLRRQTSFELSMYMAGWSTAEAAAGYTSLIQAALGGDPIYSPGGTVGQGSSGRSLTYSSPHGLVNGQGVSFGSELRFAAKVTNASTIELNAPFTLIPQAGTALNPTATFRLNRDLPSLSLFDRWSPQGAVQRILTGGMVDGFRIRINGDYHLFEFSGPAADLVDSSSFEQGQGGLTTFPQEPSGTAAAEYTVVPGHLGQVWFGEDATALHTLTGAELTLDNQVDMRAREFGAEIPRGAVPGRRVVRLSFDLYQKMDEDTQRLYRLGRQQKPMPVMFQLGKRATELCGIYLPSVQPDTPSFNDSDARLGWTFENCQVQGGPEEELVIAFG